MKSVLLAMLLMLSQQGQAQENESTHRGHKWRTPVTGVSLDAGEATEPPLQKEESAKPFRPGWGGKPKNQGSIFVPGLQVKKPQWGGTGCPEGTVGVSLTPDQTTLALLFDNYIVQAGANYRTRRDIKSCTVQIPIEIPAGAQFAVMKLDYRGYNMIPRNGRTRYLNLYSMVDLNTNKQIGRRIRRHYDFRGPLNEEYTLSSDVSLEPVWSPCGRSVQFRIETRAAAVSNGQGDDVMGTIDSLDIAAGGEMSYHLLWRKCQ